MPVTKDNLDKATLFQLSSLSAPNLDAASQNQDWFPVFIIFFPLKPCLIAFSLCRTWGAASRKITPRLFLDFYKSSSENLTTDNDNYVHTSAAKSLGLRCARIEILFFLVRFSDDDLNRSRLFPIRVLDVTKSEDGNHSCQNPSKSNSNLDLIMMNFERKQMNSQRQHQMI